MRSKRTTARRLAAGTVATAAILAAGIGTAPAEDVYPSWRYPATMQTGYRITGDAWAARVTTSGRWVLFATVDPANPGSQALHLRDRWNDQTTLVTPALVDARNLYLSDNARFVAYPAGVGATTIRDLLNNTSVTATGAVMAINNDGYYLSRSTGAGPSNLIAGRVLPNGQRDTERGAARGNLAFRDVTPSLEYAVAVQNGGLVRVAMATGTVLTGPGPFAQAAGDARISPNGRWVTSTLVNGQLLLWDTTTGQTWTRQLGAAVDNVLAVTNTGYAFFRQTRYEIEGGTPNSPIGQIRSVPFGIDIRTTTPEYRLAKDWASGEATQLVAGDIDRIIVCTTESLVPVDTNLRTDCYLRPFPPSPLAG